MKRLTLFAILFFIINYNFAQNSFSKITLEDVVSDGTFRPNYVWGINSMNDGENYSVYEYDRTKRELKIVKYSYKTGKEIETIINLTSLGIGWVSYDYVFSKDEKKILIYTNDQEIYRHSFTADFYVYELETKKLVSASEKGSQRIANLSPAGDKVSFMRDNNLFIKDLTNNEEKQITFDGKYNEIINGAPDWVYEEEFGYNQAYQWSPDGRFLAYVKFDESNVKEFVLTMYEGVEPKFEENKLYPSLYKFKYPKAGEDNSIVSVHIYDLQTGKTISADIGKNTDIYIPRIKWTQDGQFLGIERLNRQQNKIELLYANPLDGSSKVIITEDNKYYIGDEFYDNMVFLKDGKHIILLSERDGFRHLYLYDVNGNLVKQLTQGKWDVISYLGFDENTKTVYYQSVEESPIYKSIYSITLDGKKTKISTSKGENEIEFSKGFKYYINTFSNATTPYYITLHNAKGKMLRVLEDNADLVELVKLYGGVNKTFFSFKTSEGVSLNIYRIVPPDFDSTKHHAVIVTQYNGPNHQRVLDTWNFGWENYLTQLGFVIIGVDTRGTGGRGEEFRKITYKVMGKYETIDLIETAKYLAKLPYIDKERIGIWGWSYGGFMVLNAMTKGNGIYNTGVSVAPVTNWRYYDNIYTERYMGKPQDNAKGYDDNSPLNFANKLQGNLLLAFGTADDNVHPQNSYEFISRLIEAEKQFATLPYPNRNHGIYGGNTSIHLYKMKTDFLVKHLKPEIKK